MTLIKIYGESSNVFIDYFWIAANSFISAFLIAWIIEIPELGRKKTMIYGFTICAIFMGICYYDKGPNFTLLVMGTSFFNFSLCSVVFMFAGEIYETRIRGTGIAAINLMI